jgi:hypothetical protein
MPTAPDEFQIPPGKLAPPLNVCAAVHVFTLPRLTLPVGQALMQFPPLMQ